MPLKTNSFTVSGFIAQPDGQTPAPGDIEVVITNDGVASNSNPLGGPFHFCTLLQADGRFSVTFSPALLLSPPPFLASAGDTLTVSFNDLNTHQPVPINITGLERDLIVQQNNFIRLLTDADIVAVNGDVHNPIGEVEIFVTLVNQQHLHSDNIEFTGTIFQADGESPVPFGLEVLVENLTKNTRLTITALEGGDYSQFLPLPHGFDSGDIIRLSVRNSFTGLTLPINHSGESRNYIVRALTDDEVVAIHRDANFGRFIQSFVLKHDFPGLLLPPNTITAIGKDDVVSVSWSSVLNPNLVGYAVYRSISASGPFFKISGTAPLDTTQFNDFNVYNGTSYFYQVTTFDNVGESTKSIIATGTPQVIDNSFCVRQFLDEKFIAGRQITVSYSLLKISGDPNAVTISLKYLDFSNSIQTTVISAPVIGINNSYKSISDTIRMSDQAKQLLEIRINQRQASIYLIDNLRLQITGNTKDPTARDIVWPSYSADNKIIAFKNRLPGIAYFVDAKTGILKDGFWDTGNGQAILTNTTEDPIEFTSDDTSIVFPYITGIDANNKLLTVLERVDFLKDPNQSTLGTSVLIHSATQIFFPKINKTKTSCDPLHSDIVVYLQKNTNGNTNLASIGLKDDNIVNIRGTINVTGAKSLDLDTDGDMVFCTDDEILMNNYIQGGQNRTVLPQGANLVQWGNKQFIPGKLIAFDDITATAINTYNSAVITGDGTGTGENQAEYLLDTTLFPDGRLDVTIIAIDEAQVPNHSQVTLHLVVNNSIEPRRMYATAITDPAASSDTSLVTAPGAIVGGITNKCAVLSAGISSANNGKMDFLTPSNLLLTTVNNLFAIPTTHDIAVSPGTPISAPLPLKIRFTWQTDQIPSESRGGGRMNPCILTVDTGGVIRNIFLPEIDTATQNPLMLYVAEDGSTYLDQSLKCLARKATNEPLLDLEPELDILPQFTSTAAVNLSWCLQPGDPLAMIKNYVLTRSTDINGNFNTIFSTIDNQTHQYQDKKVVNGTLYFYRIAAIDLLGNVIHGNITAFTIIDKTGALQKLGFIQVDLNTDDVEISDNLVLEPGTGKVFSERTTFNLDPTENIQIPPLTIDSALFADYTFQKPKDILFRLGPVDNVTAITGDISGAFVKDRDFIFIKDDGVLGGSTQARDKIRFIKQQRIATEEEVVRGSGAHTSDTLGHLFAQSIGFISMPVTVRKEPAVSISGFLIQITSTEPGHLINGIQQTILQVTEVNNVTAGVEYEVNDIVPIYTTNPALLQLDIFTNMTRNPPPQPTDVLEVTYQYLKVFPKTSYQLDRSTNSVQWLGIDPTQPAENQRYLVTYHYLAPIPSERLTLTYGTNALVRTLQLGDLNTGIQGLNQNRHICADVLAKETNIVPVDIEMTIRLFDTADLGFSQNQITATIGALFENKQLGQGMRISDISTAVDDLTEVESIKLDPFTKLGRTDLPTFLQIYMKDTKNFSVHPGKIEGQVTFFTTVRPTADVVIPSNTIVSNDLNNTSTIPVLFETTSTTTAPLNSIEQFYNLQKNRYEFRVNVRALFLGSARINRKQISTIGGILKNSLEVENENAIEGAIVHQEVMTGNGTLVLAPKNGQLLEVLKLQNYSAQNMENTPKISNFIQLQKSPVANIRGDDIGAFGNSSLVFDDNVVFLNAVANQGDIAQPGDYYVNFQEGYIKTFTKTPSNENAKKITYRYVETYNLDFTTISQDGKTFTLNGAVNAGKPAPKNGDHLLVDYRWKGDGIPLQYRLETFSNSQGILDLSYLDADVFTGSIFVGADKEEIHSVNNHPATPFYAYNPATRFMSIVGRPLIDGEEIVFQFSTPFGECDVAMTAFNLQTRNNISRFTFNLDFQTLQIDRVEYLQMSGTSVQNSPGMEINGGSDTTNEHLVVVQLAAIDAKDMILSEDILFRDKTDLNYVPFAKATTFNLSPNDGQKTIYARIRFANTAIQPVELQSPITLDSNSSEGGFFKVDPTEVLYSQNDGTLRIPTSFDQSDIIINDMESVVLNSLIVTIDNKRVKRIF